MGIDDAILAGYQAGEVITRIEKARRSGHTYVMYTRPNRPGRLYMDTWWRDDEDIVPAELITTVKLTPRKRVYYDAKFKHGHYTTMFREPDP